MAAMDTRTTTRQLKAILHNGYLLSARVNAAAASFECGFDLGGSTKAHKIHQLISHIPIIADGVYASANHFVNKTLSALQLI